MIGVGIIGCNYGRNVLLPAFRSDPRCAVVALAGSEAKRTAEIARAANVSQGYGDWRALIEDKSVGAVAIAVPPALQGTIARDALALGKPVFAEKPLADNPASARTMLEAARASARPTMIDFNFPELATWQRAKELLGGGRIGRLRHVVVTWNTENAATRLRLNNWKTQGEGSASGLLGNFVCHCLYYLEWFCGSICGVSGRIFPLPGKATQGSIALALAFASGAGASLQMSCALSRLRSPDRILWRGRHACSRQSGRRLFPGFQAHADAARRRELAKRGRDRRVRGRRGSPHRPGVASGAPFPRRLRER